MHWVVGILAASILGAEGPKALDAPQITYQLKIVEMHGLGWRSAAIAQLQPVARQGSVTVWTAPRETGAKIAESAGKVVAAPRVSALSRARATIYSQTTRNLMTGVSWKDDGLVVPAAFGRAALIGCAPTIESASEGWSAKVTGRKLDQGVLVNLTLEDRQITAVHPVVLTSEAGSKRSAKDGMTDEYRVGLSLQVPEVANAEVEGEWVIPNGCVLVASFGAHTVADADGKAVVRERLALLEANAVATDESPLPFAPARITLPLLKNFGLSPAAAIPMPVPAAPSRSLPLPLNAGGEHVPLPPLPDDQSAPPTSIPGSSEPCATPQLKGIPLGDPIPSETDGPRDPASKKAGYLDDASCATGKTAAGSGWSPSPARTFSFRLPNVEIEIRAVAVPRPSPSASAPAPPEVSPSSR